MKARVAYCALYAAGAAAQWLIDQFDTHVAACDPDSRYGTFIWHRHSWGRWAWWATHSTFRDGTQYRDYARISKLPG